MRDLRVTSVEACQASHLTSPGSWWFLTAITASKQDQRQGGSEFPYLFLVISLFNGKLLRLHVGASSVVCDSGKSRGDPARIDTNATGGSMLHSPRERPRGILRFTSSVRTPELVTSRSQGLARRAGLPLASLSI